MYTSIDAAAAALQAKLRKYKERRVKGFHAGNGMGEDLMAVLEAMDTDTEEKEATSTNEAEYVDPEFPPTITKVNSFDLENPIPVKEAIFALDYVDHDFFVFKNEETNKVNVIYKRTAGGVGLI